MKISLAPVLVLVFAVCNVTFAADSDSDKSAKEQPAKEKKDESSKPCNCGVGDAGFPLYCPAFDVMTTGTGEDLWYCNYYPTSCDDIPEEAYAWEPSTFQPGPCPDNCVSSFGCSPTRVKTPVTNMHALPEPTAISYPPFTNSNVIVTDKHYYCFQRGSDPKAETYICVYSLSHNESDAKKCHTFYLGLEVNWTAGGSSIQSQLRPLPNFETVNDYLYTTELGGRSVLILCTSCKTDNVRQPTAAKASTPGSG